MDAIWVSSEASSLTRSVVGYECTFTGRGGDGRLAALILRLVVERCRRPLSPDELAVADDDDLRRAWRPTIWVVTEAVPCE